MTKSRWLLLVIAIVVFCGAIAAVSQRPKPHPPEPPLAEQVRVPVGSVIEVPPPSPTPPVDEVPAAVEVPPSGSALVRVRSSTDAYDPEKVRVRLECEGSRYTPTTRTGGSCLFDDLPPGEYQVSVDADGTGYRSHGTLPVEDGQSARFEVDLRGQAEIFGRILMHGRPLADAGALTVEMTRSGWKLPEPDYEFPVAADGSFAGTVRRAEYSLEVVRAGRCVGTFTWPISDPEERRDFELVELFRLSGCVLDRDGQPVPKVCLFFSETRAGGRFNPVETDRAGRFETRLAAGSRHFARLSSKSLGVIALGTVTLTEDTTVEFRLPPGAGWRATFRPRAESRWRTPPSS